MKIDGFAIMVLMLSIGSACVSAVILSSETLNVEPTVSSTQGNEQQSDIFDENLNDFHIKTKRTFVNSEEKTKSDGNEYEEVKFDEKPKMETQLPQPSEQESSGEYNSEDKNVVSNVPMTPTISVDAISVDDASKEVLVEAPIVGDGENILEVDKNDSSILQPETTTPTIVDSEYGVVRDQNELLPETIDTDGPKMDSNNISIDKDLTEENQIPVFSEWAQKRLEEVEKEVEQEAVNTSTMKKNAPATNKQPVLKLKNSKNYASPDCGAKIIAANAESSGTGYVLTSTKDEYLLSPCKSRIWFIVELCEAIQAERIDLANFELFSSSPKNFSVGVSSRFPTRDWSNVGKFIAKDERYIQSFDLYPHLFGKYVRVDIHSHYNSEHFCPISLFRVYGTSEFEAFETENRQHNVIDDIDIDDDDEVLQESDVNERKTNIFKSASDAVMSLVDTVKKAASFVKPNGNKTIDNGSQNVSNQNIMKVNCISPNHVINCENCSNDMTNEVTALIECKQNLLKRLLNINIIRDSIYKSRICNTLIGLDLNINCSEPPDINSTTSKQLTDLQMNYIINLFSMKYITAMCNILAAADRKIAWNSTISINSDPPINVTIDQKASSQLLSREHQVKPTPQIVQRDQIQSGTSQDNSAEFKLQMEKRPVITSESMEHSQEIESNENRNMDNIEKEAIEWTTPLPVIESSEDIKDSKNGQNIFNVADTSDETNTESQNVLVEVPTSIEAMKEPITTSTDQEITPPSVILLPETTTQSPTIDLNDANEEQANNGLTNSQQLGQKLHSESVFLRLSNRVKALELNMSLSGQYLEELSRRYKKQVEDLQMSFAKTLVNIEEQSRRNLERKQELFEQNQKLRNDLEILTERIFSWRNILLCCTCFTCVQILIFHLILKIWGRKYGLEKYRSSNTSSSEISNIEIPSRKHKIPMKFRRKSAEEKRDRNPSELSTTTLQRRPSTEALNITGTYTELLINDLAPTQHSPPNYNHPLSDGHDADISGYVKIEDLKDMYNKPEEEYEFYGPVPELKKYASNSQADDCISESTIDSSVDSVTSHPKKSKAIRNKNRSLSIITSSPSFFKSPFSSGPTAQSTGWEWHRSKKSYNSSQISKKSKSESPPSLKKNGINNNKINGKNLENQKSTRNDPTQSSISSSADDRKTSGSFKRIFKKIF